MKANAFKTKMRGGWRRGAALLALCGAAGVGLACWRMREKPVFPGEHWTWKSPAAAGFSEERLRAFSAKAGGAGCIVHGGEMIYEWGDPAFRGDVASSTKPIYAFLAFKAVETGRIESLDERVAKRVPELETLEGGEGEEDREMTFRHLLSQTSGYGLKEKPGEAFAYNDFATGLLAWALFHRVYGCPRGQDDEVLNGDLLGRAIGFEDAPTVVHRNSRPYRIRISARDMARFALMYLRGGTWNGKRVLARRLYREHMAFSLPVDFPRTAGEEMENLKFLRSIGGGKDQKNHLGCLGYFWWFNRTTPDGTLFLPDAPKGTFMGSGYGGRFAMVIVPEQDLIAVWLGVHEGEEWSPLSEVGRFRVNEMLRELLAARTVGGERGH